MATSHGKKSRTEMQGTVYLIHFGTMESSTPLAHARNYIGWTAGPVEDRIAEHRAGRGARIMEVVTERRIPWVVALTRPGTRTDERKLKNRHGAHRLCPICKALKALQVN